MWAAVPLVKAVRQLCASPVSSVRAGALMLHGHGLLLPLARSPPPAAARRSFFLSARLRGAHTAAARRAPAPRGAAAGMATQPQQRRQQQLHRTFGVSDAELDAAGAMLRDGGCVAFPTETVYGLGAHALDERAVLDVFKHKGRPLTDPLIVHVPTAEQALELLVLAPAARAIAAALAASFWPGPLTLVGKAVPRVPLTVTAGTGFVGVRVPAHPIALRLLAAARVPVAAPSANRFGHVSPTSAAHVVADLGHAPIGVVVGEAAEEEEEEEATGQLGAAAAARAGGLTAVACCAVGIESSVVKVEEEVAEDEAAAGGAPPARGGGGGEGVDAASLARVRLVVYRRGGVSVAALEAACADAAAALGHPGVRVPVEYRTLHAPHVAAEPAPASSPPAAEITAPRPPPAAAAATATPAAAIEGGAVAPGMLLTHYAPDLATYMVAAGNGHHGRRGGGGGGGGGVGEAAGDAAAATAAAAAAAAVGEAPGGAPRHPPFDRALLPRTVVIDVGGQLAALRACALAYEDLSAAGSMTEARARLFAALRRGEEVPGAAAVLLADPLGADPGGGGGGGGGGWEHADALRDRMFRAASGRLVAQPRPL